MPVSAANTARSSQFTPAQFAPGFTDLINVLLGVQAPAPAVADDSQSAAGDASPNSETLRASISRPAAQVADAMIRSMFASSSNLAAAGNVATENIPRKTPVRAAQTVTEPVTLPVATAPVANAPVVPPVSVVAPVINVMMQSPLLQSRDAYRGSGTTGAQGFLSSKLPFGAAVIPAASKVAPTPLAFGMRLTPAFEPEPQSQRAIVSAPAKPVQPAGPVEPAESVELAGSVESAEPAPSVEPVVATTETQPQPKVGDTKPAADTKAAPAGVDAKTKQDAETHEEPAPIVVAATTASSAANDGSHNFAGQMLNNVATVAPPQGGGKLESPAAPSAAEALRTSEPAPPAPSTQPVTSTQPAAIRELSVRIATPQAPAVDVHLIERGGELHVAVRTADGGLQTSLRENLGTLVNSLERSGYRAEAFTPREEIQQLASSTQMNSQNGRQESESGSGRGNTSGDGSQNSGGQPQQRQRDQRAQKWIEEMENLQ